MWGHVGATDPAPNRHCCKLGRMLVHESQRQAGGGLHQIVHVIAEGRLRGSLWRQVDHTGFSTVNPQRFGQKFVGRVANPHDMLTWHKAPLRRVRARTPIPRDTAYQS